MFLFHHTISALNDHGPTHQNRCEQSSLHLGHFCFIFSRPLNYDFYHVLHLSFLLSHHTLRGVQAVCSRCFWPPKVSYSIHLTRDTFDIEDFRSRKQPDQSFHSLQVLVCRLTNVPVVNNVILTSSSTLPRVQLVRNA